MRDYTQYSRAYRECSPNGRTRTIFFRANPTYNPLNPLSEPEIGERIDEDELTKDFHYLLGTVILDPSMTSQEKRNWNALKKLEDTPIGFGPDPFWL
ncbi:MAG TPA: hypothetical protein VJH20_04775 [Candidatus Nanoarchaeia archaeon]|nr:hypothetical protein [Candidatus Nanoarchaeia archaeon]